MTDEETVVTNPLLRVRDLEVAYGPVSALSRVSFDVAEGTAVAVLGTNGAGKSTLGRALSGLVPPTAGSVEFDGQDVTRLAPEALRRLGVCYVPEGRGIFPGLSVEDNLRMAVRWEPRHLRKVALESAYQMFPVLGDRRAQRAGSMSGGEQQMLALGRALAVPPRLLIADELSLGLAPKIVNMVFDTLTQARDSGVTVLLIEQFVHRALAFADSCLVLQRGSVTWSGTSGGANQAVLDRYLGTTAAS